MWNSVRLKQGLFFSDKLAFFVFWVASEWIVACRHHPATGSGLASKEYAELEWPIDLCPPCVWISLPRWCSFGTS